MAIITLIFCFSLKNLMAKSICMVMSLEDCAVVLKSLDPHLKVGLRDLVADLVDFAITG